MSDYVKKNLGAFVALLAVLGSVMTYVTSLQAEIQLNRQSIDKLQEDRQQDVSRLHESVQNLSNKIDSYLLLGQK